MMPRSRFFALGAGTAVLAAVLFAVVPAGAGYWVAGQAAGRLDLQVSGTFRPDWFRSSFRLENGGFVWKDRVEVLSGGLHGSYDPVSLLSGKIRIKLHGKDVRIRLAEAWARDQGVEETTLDRFEADVELGTRGLSEIYLVNAESSALQFRIRKI